MKDRFPNPGDVGYIQWYDSEIPVIFINHPLIEGKIALYHPVYINGKITEAIVIRALGEDIMLIDWSPEEYEIDRDSMNRFEWVYRDFKSEVSK